MADEVENPAAFPRDGKFREIPDSCGTLETLVLPQDGMTLRDYFAAKAVQGYIAAGAFRIYKNGIALTDDISGAAYELADSMLKTRNQD